MTFEPGRKKQLLVLQPKGKPLYEAEGASKSFGMKMLESMGWKKGNGLGRAQQGNLEFIQVRYKNNSNGLGFDGLKDNQWTETEASFDNLLKNLNSQSNSNSNSSDETEKKSKTRSLEEKSKNSRARVHYKKFTRGKDVHKYSEKDLANILGKKTLKEDVVTVEQSIKPEVDEKPDTYKSDLIVNTGISITEYFKQKKNEKTGKTTDEPDDTVEELPQKPEKRKKKKESSKAEVTHSQHTVENENEQPETEQFNDRKQKKKKRKVSQTEAVSVEEPDIPNKKKKSKKLQEVPQDIEPEPLPKKKKKKNDRKDSDESHDVSSPNAESSNVQSQTNQSTKSTDDRPKQSINNSLYSTDVITIPSHVAQKMSSVLINNFNNSNLGNIVGYGMTNDIEIKVVETKMGGQINNDKYALYNTDRITKPRINTRKILTKIKKTKKSIQVI